MKWYQQMLYNIFIGRDGWKKIYIQIIKYKAEWINFYEWKRKNIFLYFCCRLRGFLVLFACTSKRQWRWNCIFHIILCFMWRNLMEIISTRRHDCNVSSLCATDKSVSFYAIKIFLVFISQASTRRQTNTKWRAKRILFLRLRQGFFIHVLLDFRFSSSSCWEFSTLTFDYCWKLFIRKNLKAHLESWLKKRFRCISLYFPEI
jgi:hypothetical protein